MHDCIICVHDHYSSIAFIVALVSYFNNACTNMKQDGMLLRLSVTVGGLSGGLVVVPDGSDGGNHDDDAI